MLLNVTSTNDIPTWIGYIVDNGIAYPLAGGTLDSLRAYALREGFDGILIGSPSVEWAQARAKSQL